jgi:hypothetical protein
MGMLTTCLLDWHAMCVVRSLALCFARRIQTRSNLASEQLATSSSSCSHSLVQGVMPTIGTGCGMSGMMDRFAARSGAPTQCARPLEQTLVPEVGTAVIAAAALQAVPLALAYMLALFCVMQLCSLRDGARACAIVDLCSCLHSGATMVAGLNLGP